VKVDGSLKSLLQGVSQQPPRDRLPGQATAQDNMSSDPVQGLTRRPPTDLVGKLGSATTVLGWHSFGTRDGSKFLAWFHDGDVQVFNLNAIEYNVTLGTGASAYLSSGGIRCNTDEEDNTVVVNRDKQVAMLADVPTYLNTGTFGAAIVQILGGQYGKTYSISINGVQASQYKTPDGSSAEESENIDTAYIAGQLQANWTLSTYNVNVEEDILYINKSTGGPFSITASDGVGNINIKAMAQSVPGTEDLPRLAPHRYVVRVAEKTDPEKDLWFCFIVEGKETVLTPSGADFGKAGYWQECVAPDVPYKFDLATMPYILEYDGTDFELNQGAWEDRKVGTLVSNPNPSFVGKKIKDVSSFQGRLVFVAGSNVCTSRTNRPRDFWFGTASALADTDPIDINSTVESSVITAAVQHNRDLVVFSQEAQFVLYGRSKATPENSALVLTTRFESEEGAHPVGSGRNVFFASNYGAYTAMREFYAEGDTGINDSRPVTQHVKRYIEGRAVHLSSSSNYDTLLVHTDKLRNSVYVYQYIWSDTEKVQSAWSKWNFGHEIVFSFFDEDRIYLVQKVGTDYYLLRMPLDVQITDGVPYAVHLDQRFDVFAVNREFILPYDYLHGDRLVCVQATGCPNPGLAAQIESIEYSEEEVGWKVTLKRPMGSGNIVVGSRYLSSYKPTMPYVKDSDGVVIGTGNLRVRNFLVSLFNTGHISGQVLSKYSNSGVVEFNGRIVGAIENIIGSQPLVDAEFLMPFRHDVDHAEVVFFSDSHLPATMLDIEWQGQYSKRGRRITGGG